MHSKVNHQVRMVSLSQPGGRGSAICRHDARTGLVSLIYEWRVKGTSMTEDGKFGEPYLLPTDESFLSLTLAVTKNDDVNIEYELRAHEPEPNQVAGSFCLTLHRTVTGVLGTARQRRKAKVLAEKCWTIKVECGGSMWPENESKGCIGDVSWKKMIHPQQHISPSAPNMPAAWCPSSIHGDHLVLDSPSASI